MINRTTLAALAKENESPVDNEALEREHERLRAMVLDILAKCEQEARKGKHYLHLPNWRDGDVLNAIRCQVVLRENYGLTVDVDIGHVTISWD